MSFPWTFSLSPEICSTGSPLLKDLKEVNYLFSTIPDVRIVMIAGNHDRVRKSSAVLSFNWAPNVTFLSDEEFSSRLLRGTAHRGDGLFLLDL